MSEPMSEPMKEERYFLIRMTEDGAYFQAVPKGFVLHMLEIGEIDHTTIVTKLPELIKLEDHKGTIILKGNLVVPRAVEVATKFQI